jgi:hypothetical protein
MATINDRRTDTTTIPLGYVVCTDGFLSGWGGAKGGRSLYALAFHNWREADILLDNADARSEMKRPRTVTTLLKSGLPKLRMGANDHLSIADKGDAARWYQPGGFR